MKFFFFLISFFSLIYFKTDFCYAHYSPESIKRYVEETPRQKEENLYSLVRYLTKPFNDNYDKAQAIAFWIASHINYDEYLFSNGKKTRLLNNYKSQTPQALLKSRAGICIDFAKLFQEMCQKAGIRAGIIRGHAFFIDPKNSLFREKKHHENYHAWNYFIYKSKKIYVDTTWMAEGSLSVSGTTTNLGHKNALKQMKRDNKYHSQTNTFDDYYFDFNYKSEIHDRNCTHQEN